MIIYGLIVKLIMHATSKANYAARNKFYPYFQMGQDRIFWRCFGERLGVFFTTFVLLHVDVYSNNRLHFLKQHDNSQSGLKLFPHIIHEGNLAYKKQITR